MTWFEADIGYWVAEIPRPWGDWVELAVSADLGGWRWTLVYDCTESSGQDELWTLNDAKTEAETQYRAFVARQEQHDCRST